MRIDGAYVTYLLFCPRPPKCQDWPWFYVPSLIVLPLFVTYTYPPGSFGPQDFRDFPLILFSYLNLAAPSTDQMLQPQKVSMKHTLG
jgi:hypothetical protein